MHARAAAIARRLRALLTRERALVAALFLIVGGLWTFIEILDEIEGGETEEVDVWVDRILRSQNDPARPIGPDWLITAALDLTALGSAAVLALVVALASLYLALQREYPRMWLLLLSAALAQAISFTLKAVIGRPRPDEAFHLAEVSTASFPSGHAMLSAVVYLTLGAVLASTRTARRERIAIIAAAVLLTGAVGLTRIYIGVHYTTDVLAGWALGLAWAVVCLTIAARLRRKPRPTPRSQAPDPVS